MKKRILEVLFIALCPYMCGMAQDMPETIEPLKAPFEMPQLERPVFPERSISIVRTGAIQGTVSTKAIQSAIDRMARKGGGTVIVPAGKWKTGRIQLRSNIRLQIDEGAELCFSGDIKDYLPAVLTRNEGVDIYSMGAMIYADSVENIAVTGRGRLVSPGYDCEISNRRDGGISDSIEAMPLEGRVFDGRDGGKVFMPVFFGPVNSRNILVEGVTFERSIFWNIAPVYCENIIIRGVTVNSFGRGRTDGIDIDSSVNTLVEYTVLDCGDDCFTLKAGRGNDGVDRARPTENVVIRHCRVKRGVGGLAIGSETAAGISNVYMHDCDMDSPKFPFYMKTRRPRGGGVSGIFVERVRIKNSTGAVFNFDMLGSARWVGELAQRLPKRPVDKLTPAFSGLTFKDITIDKCTKLIDAKGLPEQPIERLVFENIKSPDMRMTMQDVGMVTFR